MDKIRSGRLTPQSIRVCVLLPDMSRPLAFPAAASGDEADGGRARARMETITARHLSAIRATVEELQELGFVGTAAVEARVHGSAPLFKAYMLNDEDVFFGYYPVQEHDVRDDAGQVTIYDSAGKDAEFPTTQPTATRTRSARSSLLRRWYDSVWNTIATEAAR